MKRNEKRSFYCLYTVLFLLLAAVVVFFYYSQSRTMIDKGGDGFRQHYRSLLYYSNYLKSIIHSFFSGSFSIPYWDFAIGEGSDILSTLHYYCIGDIFTVLSCLFPEKYMYYCYDLVTVLRMYCAGLSFSALCFYKKKKGDQVLLLAALLYAFCPLCLSNMASHVFFLSAVVYFPLIILGVEKVINGDKPYVLVLSVMLSSLSNIYFFYMNALSTVFYSFVRLLLMSSSIKEKFKKLLQIGLYSFWGVLMSAAVFLPVAYSIVSGSRLDSAIISGVLYPLEYYKQMLMSLSFAGYMFYGGFSVIGLIALIELFLKRNNKTLLVLFVLGTVFACVPFFGKLYNALVYPTPRWLYAVSLLVNYIIVEEFADLEKLKKDIPLISAVLFIYFVVCLVFDRGRWQISAVQIVFLLAAAFVIFKGNNKRIYKTALLMIVFASIGLEIIYSFSPNYWNTAGNGMKIDKVVDLSNDEHYYFDGLSDDSFFRYSGEEMTTNQSIHGEHSSTQFYWSISNGDVIDFRKELGLSDHNNHHYDHYDGRFGLNALASVRYYIAKQNDPIPYGFEKYEDYNDQTIFKSSYALPLVYAYDSYLAKDDFEKLPVEAKNEVLLQSAVIDKKIEGFKETKPQFVSQSVAYTVVPSENTTFSDGLISIKGEGGGFDIVGKSDQRGEYYIAFEGFDSDMSSNIIVKYGEKEKILFFKSRYHSAYPDKHDFLICLGFMENGLEGPISIRFPDKGEYSYKSLKLIDQPLEQQIESIEKLKNGIDYTLRMSDDRLNIKLTSDNDRILCFAIPYSKGWRAVCDGKEVELATCNIQYMCMPIEKGAHEIVLTYSTPMLKEGMILSAISTLAFLALWFKNRKYNRISEV